MDEQDISGKQIRPDGTEEYWWHGVNYINVLPEELIDAIKDSDMLKVKTKYRIRNEKWTKEQGKAKVAIYNDFQKNYPFQDA